MPKRPSHTPGPDDRPLWPAAVQGTEDDVITGQVVGSTSPARSAQTLVGEWVDWCQVKPSKRIRGQVAKYLGAMLNEDGIPYDVVRNGLRAWARSGTNPATLDSFVYTAGNAPQEQNRGRRWSGEATVAGGLAAIAAAERMVAGQ